MNDIIVYEKEIDCDIKNISFLYYNHVNTKQDYYRCLYKGNIFNVLINKMPKSIITLEDVPPIILERLIVLNSLENN